MRETAVKRQKGFVLATLAGTCAGLASVFGKLAVDGTWVRRGMAALPLEVLTGQHDPAGTEAQWIESGLRGLCFALVFVSNMVMWNLFVKSMNFSSSVMATVVNSATNFFSSAVLGYLLFAEPLPTSWWIGSTFIIAGLFFLARGQHDASPTIEDERKAKKD